MPIRGLIVTLNVLYNVVIMDVKLKVTDRLDDREFPCEHVIQLAVVFVSAVEVFVLLYPSRRKKVAHQKEVTQKLQAAYVTTGSTFETCSQIFHM